MTTVDDIYGTGNGRSLKADDLKGKEWPMTVEKIDEYQFDDGKKLILNFAATDKSLILNKTNARTIADMHGQDPEGWKGKEIILYPTTTTFGDQTVPCVRVRDEVERADPDEDLPF